MGEKNESENFERFSCIIIEKNNLMSTHGKAKMLLEKGQTSRLFNNHLNFSKDLGKRVTFLI